MQQKEAGSVDPTQKPLVHTVIGRSRIFKWWGADGEMHHSCYHEYILAISPTCSFACHNFDGKINVITKQTKDNCRS